MAAAGQYFPISELSTYQSKWIIRARVTSKAQLRTFQKGGGPGGKVFHVELLDAAGGEIRASFFNAAADAWVDKLQQGKCYTFSRGSVKVANRQYNTTNHRYEIIFDREAVVEESPETADDPRIDTIKLTVTDLRTLRQKNLPCTVDLCGVVVSFKQSQSFTSRDGKELVKREVTLADDTGNSMVVTLWGDRAKQEDKLFEGHPVFGIKGVNVKEWQGGRSGSLLEAGALVREPATPEAQRLREWWSQGGSAQSLASLSQEGAVGGGGGGRAAAGKAMTITDMRKAAERVTDTAEIFNVICRLTTVQTRKQGETQPLVYLACQETKEGSSWACNRRVDESGFCAACGRAGKAALRLNIRCKFADFEDSAWLTTFHEAAQKVLAMEAADVQAMEKADGREALESAIRKQYFQQPYQVTVKAKLDSWQGEPRMNISCVEARPVNRSEHGRALLAEIREMVAAHSTRAGGA